MTLWGHALSYEGGGRADVIDISAVSSITDAGGGSGGSATLEFLANGTWDNNGPNAGFPADSGNWCNNHPPANNYWIRATITSGAAFSSGSGTGSWISMAGTVFWNNTKSTAGTKTNTITLEIATDAAGSNIIATKTGVVIAAQF